jgi:hypothetical protein
MKKNTDRLLNLTNQLLDFRKTEKEMLRLNLYQDRPVRTGRINI